jgi:hypothetical protein
VNELNLDTLQDEILTDLESRALVIFHSELRSVEMHSAIYWDVETHPDYRQFLDAAVGAGAKLVTVFSSKFSAGQIEEALAQLEDADLDHQEKRAIELRLREMRLYDGLTCHIELSFNHAQRDYIFDIRTQWFQDYEELLDRIDESFAPPEEEDEGPLGGGYYSKN